MNPEGISVVIPCLNEAGTIGRGVEQALRAAQSVGLPCEVIVADNGSSDSSQSIAEKAGARVVAVPIKGYGAALDTGIRSAKYSIVTFGDADLSYPFDEIPALVQPLIQKRAEFVLGNRLNSKIETGAMPTLNRHLGTPVLSAFIRWIYRLPTSDCNSGMRAILKTKYDELGLKCPGMEYASEMLIRAAEHKLKYAEVDISFRKDQRGRPPHLRRWRDGWRHLRFIVGNAPSPLIVNFPGLLAALFFFMALVISFTRYIDPASPIRFHTAFILIALGFPLALFSITALLIKRVMYANTSARSSTVEWLDKLSQTATPFYFAMGLFGLAALQTLWTFVKWQDGGFHDLFEMAAVIRVMVFSAVGTCLFTLDLGLGLIGLVVSKDQKA